MNVVCTDFKGTNSSSAVPVEYKKILEKYLTCEVHKWKSDEATTRDLERSIAPLIIPALWKTLTIYSCRHLDTPAVQDLMVIGLKSIGAVRSHLAR